MKRPSQPYGQGETALNPDGLHYDAPFDEEADDASEQDHNASPSDTDQIVALIEEHGPYLMREICEAVKTHLEEQEKEDQ